MKKLLAFFLVVLSAIAFNRCNPYDTVTVTGVALNSKTLDLAPGETVTLKATVIPDYATNRDVIWTSDNDDVATVDKNTGEITAVAAGEATITVTTADGGKTATCTVTVTSSAPATVPVTEVSLDKTTLLLVRGADVESAESATLVAAIKPENATNPNLSWESDKPAVATVDDKGKVTAVAEGTATITVTTKDGDKNAECTVTVFEMVYVEGGTFLMGAQNDDDEKPNYYKDIWGDEEPVHPVTLWGYYMGKFEVTQGLWKAVMGSNPSSFQNGDNYPVENVSWDDIKAFLSELNDKTGMYFTLPTEAQWEFAAAGGNAGYNSDDYSRKHLYSGSDKADDVAWWGYYNNPKGTATDQTTYPVGQIQPNELGIYDMSGNVYEWCADLYDYDEDWDDYYYYQECLEQGTVVNPKGPATGSIRVLRGGGWGSDAGDCTVSSRNYGDPDVNSYGIGFRLALVFL